MFEIENMINPTGRKLLFNILLHVVLLAAIWFTAALFYSYTFFHKIFLLATISTFFIICLLYVGRYLALFFTTPQGDAKPQILFSCLALVLIGKVFIFFFSMALRRHHDIFFVGITAIIGTITTIILGVLIKLIRNTINYKIQSAEANASHSQSELQLLQSQLSPHFLFNTLNNLYGLSLTDHKKIPDLILKLSDLLRYSIYDAKEQYVPLMSEIDYLHHYIEFEKIRLGNRLQLEEEFESIKNRNIRIAPMILIVFLENAFKHSKNTNNDTVQIYIDLHLWGNSILFQVKNSYDVNYLPNELNGSNGLGMENVKKRLELLYPGSRHDLKISEDGAFFDVKLRLEIK